MFRLIRFFLSLLLIVALVVGIYLWVARVPTLERCLSKQLNTEVTIENVQIGLNELTIKGLKIKNPASSTYAFQTKTLTLEMNFREFFKKRIHIDQISMQDLQFGIEFYNYSGSDNNWVRLLTHADLSSDSKHTFVINKCILKNIHFDVTKATGKEIPIPSIPHLELDMTKPLTLTQVSSTLFKAAVPSKLALGALLDNVSNFPENVVEPPLEKGLEILQKFTDKASEFFHSLF